MSIKQKVIYCQQSTLCKYNINNFSTKTNKNSLVPPPNKVDNIYMSPLILALLLHCMRHDVTNKTDRK